MSLIEFHNDDELNVPYFDTEHFVLWINDVVSAHNKEVGDLQYYFVSDESLLEMNINVLNHDFYTDIITFDSCVDDIVLGEAYISIDRVLDNAKTNKLLPMEELSRVIIHGCLHLLGYGDKSNEEIKEMRSKEDWALSLLS